VNRPQNIFNPTGVASPFRAPEFNRESREIREQGIPEILFVYLVYFAVHLICVTTSLTCFLSQGEDIPFPVSFLLDSAPFNSTTRNSENRRTIHLLPGGEGRDEGER
jgi:hypothetical protein